MKKSLSFLILLLICLTCGYTQVKQNLKVLYVGGAADFETFGNNDHSKEEIQKAAIVRTASFEKFLNQYFTTVKCVNEKDYREALSANFDVTIFDGNTPLIREKSMLIGGTFRDSYEPARVSQTFDYPALCISNASEFIGRNIGSKNDWMCLCLRDDAYNINTRHPIFQGPYKVNITLYEASTPEQALSYQKYYTESIPKTQQMWRVQTNAYNNPTGLKIGMVSRPSGYSDSPETEIISGGVSAKSPNAIAIGRHGNFFHWGFAASPDNMTNEAKLVFANAIVYTASLKGQRIISRKYDCSVMTKDYITEIANSCTEKGYKYYVESEKSNHAMMLRYVDTIKAKHAAGEELNVYEKQYLNYPTELKYDSYEDYTNKTIKRYYSSYSGKPKDFSKFIKFNMPYIYKAPFAFVIDEDAKSLKTSNTDPKILDRAISMLENGKDVEKARRILDRYTLCTFEKAADWRAWFESVKDKLFFSQSGGWYFMVNTFNPDEPANNYTAKAIYSAARGIEIEQPTNVAPVSVGAAIAVTDNGEQFVVVRMDIYNGSHIYNNVSDADSGNVPTKITLALPDGYKQSGDIIKPEAKALNTNGTTVYEERAIFAIPIDGLGEGTIKVNVEYQSCDDSSCLPPANKTLEVSTRLEKYVYRR